MSRLHLARLVVDKPNLIRFARSQGLLSGEDEGFGYALHAWLAALFGEHAPKPFRFNEARSELLGYTLVDSEMLRAHAEAFAPPLAHAVLAPDSLASKGMPAQWTAGQRLQVEVLACPVSRKDGAEKDVYLRALDRNGAEAPSREDVYLEWFERQWGDSVRIEQSELIGFSRRKLLRRPLSGSYRRPSVIERPQALFRAIAIIAGPNAFAVQLRRDIGRHRAFGFGMVLLSPAP